MTQCNSAIAVVTGIICFIVNNVLAVSDSNQSNPLDVSPDPRGYLVYCPCMGRFGNQADQFLGVLAFAKKIDRTLIVPPWVEYRRYHKGVVMVPFEKYFKVEALTAYHRIIPMEIFMDKLAENVWPVGSRKVFCYTARQGAAQGEDCNAKDGSPFGPFWDWFDVDFDVSEIYGPLFYDIQSPSNMHQWKVKYPSTEFPVLAFVGAPAAFPIVRANARLHRFIQWSDEYNQKAEDWIAKKIPDRPFLAIHLRNGKDFERACEHVESSPNMFAAEQCIGERSKYGTTTREMCYPSTSTIVEQVKKEVELNKVKTLFIATDANPLKKELQEALGDVKVVMQEDEVADPQLDLAIMGRADRFIGNCVSTYTAFAKRERDVRKLPSSFWAFKRKNQKEEL